jgi:hypothetical protein
MEIGRVRTENGTRSFTKTVAGNFGKITQLRPPTSIDHQAAIVDKIRTGSRSNPEGEPMISPRTLLTSLFFVAVFSSLGTAQDLARYRDFQFGMSLESVAKQTNMDAAAAKTIHQRPAVIQTLQWDQSSYSDRAAKDRSLRSIRFDFYNGELSKMIVTYDPVRTDGLTTDDMIEAISAIYGPATKPEKTVAVSTSSMYVVDNEKVLACWEDAQYSYSLFRSSYGNAFGLYAVSKKLDLMASDSGREADRLDKLEAPEKERAQQMKQEEDKRAAQEKARLISKPNFRP